MSVDDSRPRVVIRGARADEAALLTELTLRSKAHWGYDAEFMRAAREDLTVTPEYVRANTVFVAEGPGGVAAYYSLKRVGAGVELDNLFVAPECIGLGVGKLLWLHSLAQARRLGFSRLLIHSDPFAEGFYLRMGAKRIGETPSTVVPGRALPLLEYPLT